MNKNIFAIALTIALIVSVFGASPTSAAPNQVVYPRCIDLVTLISPKLGEKVNLCDKRFQGPVMIMAATAVMPQDAVLVAMIYAGDVLVKLAITTSAAILTAETAVIINNQIIYAPGALDMFESISAAGTVDEAMAGSLSWESTKHRDSPMVLAAFRHLQGKGMLVRKGEKCQFRCSGSVQIWGGITPGQARASVAAVFIAGTKVSFVVVSGTLQNAVGLIVPPGMTDFGNGQYINTLASDSKIEAAFNLGAGRTLGKNYDPNNTVTLGQGLASWMFKQKQYNLYIPISATMIP